jgi:hypothetical protein
MSLLLQERLCLLLMMCARMMPDCGQRFQCPSRNVPSPLTDCARTTRLDVNLPNQRCGLMNPTLPLGNCYPAWDLKSVESSARAACRTLQGRILRSCKHSQPQTLQAGSRRNVSLRHSCCSPSNSTRRPHALLPIDSRLLMASSACIDPIIPTSGESTPVSAQV